MRCSAIPAVLAAILLSRGVLPAQDATSSTSHFSNDQLEQMVAPIALYPDPLVAQVLMAATYPLETAEAARFLAKQKGADATTLDDALKGENWDASVKSLVKLPDVLNRMNDNLDWTRDLGDAFLGQKAAVLDAVQRMREKAKNAGNLNTTSQQTVTTQSDNSIVIQPADPGIVYVPTYSSVVYAGGWGYPTLYYSALYPAGWGALAFTSGVAVGSALWGTCTWGRGRGDCGIDTYRYNSFNHFTQNNFTDATDNRWKHEAQHRQGVGYRDPGVARSYGAGSDRMASARARGYGGFGASAGSGERDGFGRPAGEFAGGGWSGGFDRGGGGFSGASSVGFDRMASDRGFASRGFGGGSGGMRSGGGFRR